MTARQIADAIGARPYKVNHSLNVLESYGLVRKAGTIKVGTHPNTATWEAVE